MIKAVIFDVDGVLIDSFEGNFKFFNDLFTKFGHTPPTREEYREHFGSNMKDIIKTFSKLESEEEIEKIWQAGKERHVPYPTHLVKTPDGLEETLEVLSKEFVLGITTSRLGAHVYKMPQLTPLEKYFKILVSYEDTENHKPHPEPLFLVASRLNLLPEEIVYVGDMRTDAIAAKAAGMKAVSFGSGVIEEADASINSFLELIDLVKKF
ncbi:HAD family hydrolase [Candidatus Nomurabacteria bacterium]|nr:HAD family hydrolase [Candidatus Nomurabacteria bacterium]